MGATTFQVNANGKTVDEAFRAARESALYDYGHAGYTGTIAEKEDFELVAVAEGFTVARFIESTIDGRFGDKWGPAGAIEIQAPTKDKPGEWLFYGWASS